jgi:hypothetical protein
MSTVKRILEIFKNGMAKVGKFIWQILIHLDFSVLLLFSTFTYGQIDYQPHPQTLDYKQSKVKVEWLTSSPKNCPMDFNHLVNFINTKDNKNSGSTVTVDLWHNHKIVRSFTFPVGDLIANRIYTYKPINLREGDHVYLIFKLNPKTEGEEYVFNIYEEHRAPIKTIKVIDLKGQRIAEVKPEKVIKHKTLTDRHFRKMLRKPIAQEM